MNTDRELLELAAKAAGGDIKWDSVEACWYMETDDYPGNPAWNPLTDDGDALRLAVALGIDLEWRADGRVAAYQHATADGHCFTAFESSRGDRARDVRRAIVRAAAEIGRAML